MKLKRSNFIVFKYKFPKCVRLQFIYLLGARKNAIMMCLGQLSYPILQKGAVQYVLSQRSLFHILELNDSEEAY